MPVSLRYIVCKTRSCPYEISIAEFDFHIAHAAVNFNGILTIAIHDVIRHFHTIEGCFSCALVK